MRTRYYFVQHFGKCASDLLLTHLHSHILLAAPVAQSQSRRKVTLLQPYCQTFLQNLGVYSNVFLKSMFLTVSVHGNYGVVMVSFKLGDSDGEVVMLKKPNKKATLGVRRCIQTDGEADFRGGVIAHKVNAETQCGHKLILSQFALPVWVENV